MRLIMPFNDLFQKFWFLQVFFFFSLEMQDESQDYIKRQQLRELAMLNSNFREDSPGPSGSVSPFNSSGMKRPKTGRWDFIFKHFVSLSLSLPVGNGIIYTLLQNFHGWIYTFWYILIQHTATKDQANSYCWSAVWWVSLLFYFLKKKKKTKKEHFL